MGGWVGRSEAKKKKVCAPKIDLQFRPFLSEEKLSGLGGCVGQAEGPRLPFRTPRPLR